MSVNLRSEGERLGPSKLAKDQALSLSKPGRVFYSWAMTKTLTSPVLAVDGGGTRCRIALARGTEILQVETGSANVSSSFDLAVSEIQKGLEALQVRSGIPMLQLVEIPTYLGLAGMVSPPIAARLREALPLHHMQIEDDRPAALRGALGADDGAIAHCGTGSFLGIQTGGEQRLVGGWGAQLGDEASAQWIGRLALSKTLDVVDGLAEPSLLSTVILQSLGTSSAIIAFAATATPAEMGAYATDVTRCASKGDQMATALLQQGANYIARTLEKLRWQQGSKLCLTGGLGPHFSPYLPPTMQAALTPPQGDPMRGALALAAGYAETLTEGSAND